uniref:(northern house mosquito) hypothetical protein n=1 Tax=Culex pipiens TaxID=7175 RepID=A0A8D8HIW0_CULPI
MLSSHKSSLRKIYTLYLFLNRYCKEFSLFEVDRAAALANCVYLKLLVMIFMSCFVVTVPSRIPDEHVFQVGFIFQQYYWLQCLLLMNLFQVLFFFFAKSRWTVSFPHTVTIPWRSSAEDVPIHRLGLGHNSTNTG